MGDLKKGWLLLVILFLAGSIAGCGGAGQPGSSGSSDTGIKISATIQVNDAGTSNAGMVDVYQNPDCDGDPTTNDPEDFYDALGDLSVTTTNLSSGTGNTLYITDYSVEFIPQYSTDHYPPDLTPLTFQKSITLPPDSTTSDSVILVPVKTKSEYLNSPAGGTDQGYYSIKVKFNGESEVGEPFSFSVYTEALFTNYDNCG